MKKRTLCLMVTSATTATTFLDGYLQFLAGEGWEVTLVCGEGPGVANLAAKAGVKYVPLAMCRPPSPANDLRSIVRAVRMLRALRPNTVVYATPKASFVGAIAAWITRVPHRVYEVWGLRLETAKGLARRIYFATEWLTSTLSTVVIANSKSLAQEMTNWGINGGKDVRVLGAGSSHGVDSLWFSRHSSMPEMSSDLSGALRSSGLPVVGFVGRLHPDKGVDILFEALSLCAQRGLPIQLLILGDAEGVSVEALAANTRLETPVHHIPFTSDPRPYLRELSVLVLPSRREGFPNVVLEAASMEVPAIVSDATGCVDAVVNGVTGIIVETGDANALANALIAVLNDDAWRMRLGEAACARARNDFVPAEVWSKHSQSWTN